SGHLPGPLLDLVPRGRQGAAEQAAADVASEGAEHGAHDHAAVGAGPVLAQGEAAGGRQQHHDEPHDLDKHMSKSADLARILMARRFWAQSAVHMLPSAPKTG